MHENCSHEYGFLPILVFLSDCRNGDGVECVVPTEVMNDLHSILGDTNLDYRISKFWELLDGYKVNISAIVSSVLDQMGVSLNVSFEATKMTIVFYLSDLI